MASLCGSKQRRCGGRAKTFRAERMKWKRPACSGLKWKLPRMKRVEMERPAYSGLKWKRPAFSGALGGTLKVLAPCGAAPPERRPLTNGISPPRTHANRSARCGPGRRYPDGRPEFHTLSRRYRRHQCCKNLRSFLRPQNSSVNPFFRPQQVMVGTKKTAAKNRNLHGIVNAVTDPRVRRLRRGCLCRS